MPVVVGSCCLDEYVDQRAKFRTVEWEISWELVNHYIKKWYLQIVVMSQHATKPCCRAQGERMR